MRPRNAHAHNKIFGVAMNVEPVDMHGKTVHKKIEMKAHLSSMAYTYIFFFFRKTIAVSSSSSVGSRRLFAAATSRHDISNSKESQDNNMNSPLQDYLDDIVGADKEIPGMQYVVVDKDSVLFSYAGGIRDTASQTEKTTNDNNAVTDTTRFLSSSCTKVLTATAIWKLIKQGKIESVQDPLSRYFDQHPYGGNDDNRNTASKTTETTTTIQLLHLLNHSSGCPHPLPFNQNWLHTFINEHHTSYSEADSLRTVLQANPKLSFSPAGQRYAYSNVGYWLLGKVIETASGMSYREYLQQEILQPLGIPKEELDTEFDETQPLDLSYARGHQERWSFMTGVFRLLTRRQLWDASAGKWARFQFLCMNGPAYGGIMGTATGYSKFLQDFLKEESNSKLFGSSKDDGKTSIRQRMLWEEQRDATGNLMPSTLGGWVRKELSVASDNDKSTSSTHKYFGKPGGGPGFHSNVRIYPEAGIATVYLCNKTQVSEGPINALSDLLDGKFFQERGNQETDD